MSHHKCECVIESEQVCTAESIENKTGTEKPNAKVADFFFHHDCHCLSVLAKKLYRTLNASYLSWQKNENE